MRKRIFLSMVAAVTAAVLFVALALSVLSYINRIHELERHVSADLAAAVRLIERGTETHPTAFLSRLTLMDARGQVLWDSLTPTDEDHSQRPEVKEAIRTGRASASRMSATMSARTFYSAVRLSDGRILRAAGTIPAIQAELTQWLPWLAAVLAAALAISLAVARLLTDKIIAPINQLDLDAPLSRVPYPEIRPLLLRIEHQNRQMARTVERLRRQHAEFSALTEHMGEGFVLLDAANRILSCNRRAQKTVGKIGRIEDGLLRVADESFRTALEQAHRGSQSMTTIRSDALIERALFSPIPGDGVVIVILDVTEMVEREQMRQEFSANVSHELKTPLTSISGFAEIISKGMVQSADIPRFAGNIHAEAQRLIRLVSEIIELSRLDEGRLEAEREMVDIKAVAERIADELRATAAGLDVTIAVQGEAFAVRAIPRIIEEMLFNLVDNAIKYNRRGGSITVSLAGGRMPSVTVSDTGVGIDEQYHERVFERFFRVSKSRSKAAGGTGLGLAIVKHAALVHGATVKLRSRLGEGTAITVTFPPQA